MEGFEIYWGKIAIVICNTLGLQNLLLYLLIKALQGEYGNLNLLFFVHKY